MAAFGHMLSKNTIMFVVESTIAASILKTKTKLVIFYEVESFWFIAGYSFYLTFCFAYNTNP